MKKILFTIAIALLAATGITSQENAQQRNKGRRHFSPEEFQTKQREYITEKAQLTAEEAEAFFPLFFELQKKKFGLERDARKSINMKRGEKMSEDQCRQFVDRMGDVKIEIAKLEKEYSTKYLMVLPACKLLRIQHAETSFQRDLMKRMIQRQGLKNRPGEQR
jgi:hypothetical protein